MDETTAVQWAVWFGESLYASRDRQPPMIGGAGEIRSDGVIEYVLRNANNLVFNCRCRRRNRRDPCAHLQIQSWEARTAELDFRWY